MMETLKDDGARLRHGKAGGSPPGIGEHVAHGSRDLGSCKGRERLQLGLAQLPTIARLEHWFAPSTLRAAANWALVGERSRLGRDGSQKCDLLRARWPRCAWDISHRASPAEVPARVCALAGCK